MIYSNPEFIILFFSTLILYSICRSYRARFLILLTASLFFYFWSGLFDGIIFVLIMLISWTTVALSEKYPSAKDAMIPVGIGLIVSHLLFWKYAPWTIAQIQRFAPSFHGGRALFLPLPLGISFFTLQSVAYLIDYSREQAEFVTLPVFALFKSFFAQLLAGPIVRGSQLLPQLNRLDKPKSSDVSLGLALFVLGFVKKVAVANRVAFFVNLVFASPDRFGRVILIKALLGYAVQIWADFSGYTDMGRGAALMLGIHLPENFLSPYLARTPSEFWRRWHITLSEWIKDYLFSPMALAFRRVSRYGLFFAAVVTMFLAGLWHGAGWNFILYGFYHGALLVLERQFRFLPSPPQRFARLWNGVQILFMFCLVLIGWLFFRLTDMSLLWSYFRGLALGGGSREIAATGRSIYIGILFCFLTQALGYYDLKKERWTLLTPLIERLGRRLNVEPGPAAAASLAGLCAGFALAAVFLLTLITRPPQSGGFIYFQF